MRISDGPWPSEALVLYSMADLVGVRDGELRCIRTAARYGLEVLASCALAVDRIQDEIDRRSSDPQWAALGPTDYPVAVLGYDRAMSAAGGQTKEEAAV